MVLKDISLNKKAIYNLEKPEKPVNNYGEESIKNIGREKVEALREGIKDILFLIRQRETLSNQLIKETDSIKTEIENFLLNNKPKDSEDLKERNGLRQKQIEISELQLNEKVNCWRDIAQLKKELREKQKELSEREDRLSMFDKILG